MSVHEEMQSASSGDLHQQQVCDSISLWLPYVIGGPSHVCPVVSLWPPYVLRGGHYIFALYFRSCPIFFFSSPNLSGRRLDVYHTLTHSVALVRIYNAGLKCAASGSLQTHNKFSVRKFQRTSCKVIVSSM